MRKFWTLLLVLATLIIPRARAQTPNEQRWFNYLPSRYASSVFSDGEALNFIDLQNTVVLANGATLSVGDNVITICTTGSVTLAQDYSGKVSILEGTQWKTLGNYAGISSSGGTAWAWSGGSVYTIRGTSSIVLYANVPSTVLFVTGTLGEVTVSSKNGIFRCNGSSCELVDMRICDSAWETHGGETACLKGDVLSFDDGKFFTDVSAASFTNDYLYFISAGTLYAYDKAVNEISEVPPGSMLESDFLIEPTGAYKLQGKSITKVSSQVRLPLKGNLLDGPSVQVDNYRITYGDAGWTEYFDQRPYYRSSGLLSWQPAGHDYAWDQWHRSVVGSILDGFGDDGQGYLLVSTTDRLGQKRILLADAVSGRYLRSFGVEPIISYGSAGDDFFVSTPSSIVFLDSGVISTVTTTMPAEHVIKWNGVTYYSNGQYLFGPKVMKFPSSIRKLAIGNSGLIVLTDNSLYLIKSDGNVQDIGKSYGNYPLNVADVVADGDHIYLLSNNGIYGLLPQVHIIFDIGKDYYILNGVQKTMEVTSTIVGGRTLIPIRVVSEAFGYSVQWDESQKEAIITGMGHTIQLWYGKSSAMLDKAPIELDVAPEVVQGTMLVPLRFVVESMGLNVIWDQSNKRVEITLP